jgi:hypothetical protein
MILDSVVVRFAGGSCAQDSVRYVLSLETDH